MPTGLEVIRLYCYEWNSEKSDTEKVSCVVNAIKEIWCRAGLPVSSGARLKVQRLVTNFKSIVNTRRRSTSVQMKKEKEFISKNSYLFDVIERKSEVKLCAVKALFLSDQRNSRIQKLSDINLNESSDDNSVAIDFSDNNGTNDETFSTYGSDSELSLYSSSYESDDDLQPKKKLKKATIEKLDNARLSYRQMHLVSRAFIEEFDQNPSNYCIGISTFHSNSTKIREKLLKIFRSK